MDNLKTDILVGGSPVDLDLQRLKKEHPHFLLGCPGRVYDVFRRNKYLYRNIADIDVTTSWKFGINSVETDLSRVVLMNNDKTEYPLMKINFPNKISFHLNLIKFHQLLQTRHLLFLRKL